MEKFEGIIDKNARSMFTGEYQMVFDPLQSIQRYQGEKLKN